MKVIKTLTIVGVLLTLVILGTAAWAQNFGRSSDQWFRVTWEPRSYGLSPAIEGWVYNESFHWVGNVRLRIEGLGADDRPVGEILVWTFGDIAPNDRTYFVARTVPGAATYRITVASFDVVSRGGP